MRTLLLASVVAFGWAGTSSASVIFSSSLQDINGPYGAGTATTTTNADGKSTTVTGPGGGANRANGAFTLNTWYQNNVGGGGTVGITSTFPRSGNGSVSFSTTSDASKADLQYYFGSNGSLQSNPLATLSSVSYEFLRSSLSATDPNLAPVLRLDILKNGVSAGSLVFENVYQQQMAAPVDTWTGLSATLDSGIFWATNAALGPTFAAADGGQKTLQAWIDGNAGSTLSVYGMSIGVGSGWTGSFMGAEDNVAISFGGGITARSINGDSVSQSFNFEVAPAATTVPEPVSLALLGTGVLGMGLIRRRKRG